MKTLFYLLISACVCTATEPILPLISTDIRHIAWLDESFPTTSLEIVNRNAVPIWLNRVILPCDCADIQVIPENPAGAPLAPGEKALLVFKFHKAPHARDSSFQYLISTEKDKPSVTFDCNLEIRKKMKVSVSSSKLQWSISKGNFDSQTVQIYSEKKDKIEYKLKFNDKLIDVNNQKDLGLLRVTPKIQKAFSTHIEIIIIEDGKETLASTLAVAIKP